MTASSSVDSRVFLLPFIVASLGPAVLLLLGAAWGGTWAWAGLLSITVAVFFADKLKLTRVPSDQIGTGVSIAVAVAHFVLLVAGVRALSADMDLSDKLALYVGLSLWFGQVSNSNAHELIHRGERWLRRLGVAVYTSLLYGHHASAHPLVHHVHAATGADPCSAPRGMGFWRFVGRAWFGAARAGFHAESRRHSGLSHPYVGYALGACLTILGALMLGGILGVVVLLGLAAYAQLQLILSDYVQHYGLRRRVLSTGKPEPIGPEHSWNAPHWASSAMMLNAPRHSDHHMRPGRAFPALELDADMPVLPHSLPVMAVIALVPPLWRRIMDPRAAVYAQA